MKNEKINNQEIQEKSVNDNKGLKGWRECKLGDVIIFGNGKSRPLSEGTIPIYGGNGILGYCDKSNYQGETIIIGRVGAYCGSVYYENKPIWVSDNALVAKAKDDNHLKFLFYFLKNLELNQFAEGSSHPLVTQTLLNSIDITIPSKNEQRAIASVLSSLDDKIDLLHRQNKTLEAMAETLFRQWFIEPCKNGLPEGWEEVELGEILSETIGGDWGEDFPTRDTISVICLRGIDLENIKETGFSNVAPLRYVKPSSLEKRKLLENQILIACSGIGPIGKSLPISKIILSNFCFPVIYSNFCKRLQAKTKEIAYVMEFYISQLYKNGELNQFHTGTSIPNFNMKDFLKYKIMLPPSEIINNFFAFLENWYSKKYNSQIRTLEKLRDLLLPKLISGEIRVKYE